MTKDDAGQRLKDIKARRLVIKEQRANLEAQLAALWQEGVDLHFEERDLTHTHYPEVFKKQIQEFMDLMRDDSEASEGRE